MWAKHGFLEERGQLWEGVINKPETIYGMHLLRGGLLYKVLFLKDTFSILVAASASLRVKAAVFIWGEEMVQNKGNAPCPSSSAPECTFLYFVGLVLSFQLIFRQCSHYLCSHPKDLFSMVSGLPWSFDKDSVEYGVLEHFQSVAHLHPFSLPMWLLLQTNIIIEIRHIIFFLNQFTRTV